LAMRRGHVRLEGEKVESPAGLVQFVKAANLHLVVYGPPAVAVACILVWAVVGGWIFNGRIPARYTELVLALSAFASSASGVAQVVRREAPGVGGRAIRGELPVLAGTLWIAFTWVIAALLILSAMAGG
jgi:hypothetical protein